MSIEADRELDSLVAEKIFGHRIYRGPVPQDDIQIEHVGSSCSVPGYGWQPTTETCPHFSTDIAAAWTVIEHMQAQGWHWEVLTTTDTQYGAVFNQSPDDVYGADATTVPLAICLAALKTKDT